MVAIVGYVVGWRINNGIPSALAAVGVLLLFAFAMSWAGACLGMVMKNVEAAQATAFMIFLPTHVHVERVRAHAGHAEVFLQTIANWNPISAIAAACRELFGNPNPSESIDVWPMQHPVAAAILWSLIFIAVFAPLAVHLYRKRAEA